MHLGKSPLISLVLVLACAHSPRSETGRKAGVYAAEDTSITSQSGAIVDTEETFYPDSVRRTEARIGVLRVLIYRHVRTHDVLPERLESLAETNQREGVTLRDAWGRPMVYSRTGEWYEIRSAGKDGVMQTGDDIVGTGTGRSMPQYNLSD